MVAKLLPAQFSPDLANMIADRKAEKTKSNGMVKAAELTLQEAKARRENILKAADMKLDNAHLTQTRVIESTANQVDKTIIEQDAKIAKITAGLASMNIQISTQEQSILNMRKKTDASVALESDKLGLRGTTVKTTIKNAHSALTQVFYGISSSLYNPNVLKNSYF